MEEKKAAAPCACGHAHLKGFGCKFCGCGEYLAAAPPDRCAKCGDPESVGHEFGFRDHAFVCPRCGEAGGHTRDCAPAQPPASDDEICVGCGRLCVYHLDKRLCTDTPPASDALPPCPLCGCDDHPETECPLCGCLPPGNPEATCACENRETTIGGGTRCRDCGKVYPARLPAWVGALRYRCENAEKLNVTLLNTLSEMKAYRVEQDCRYTMGNVADFGGRHCPLGQPCVRCRLDRAEEDAENHRLDNQRLQAHDAAQREEIARLTALIESAPHDEDCATREWMEANRGPCNCWKSSARREEKK